MLADVREQIEQILTEQRVNELMTTWLQTLRSQADINRRQAASAGQ
jgi:phage baseplate assembly protein gpV